MLLLKKLSFYDPETERYFITSSAGFHWANNNSLKGLQESLKFNKTALRSRSDYSPVSSLLCCASMRKSIIADHCLEHKQTGAILVLESSLKTSSKKTALYVTAVQYESNNIFKLASFRYSPDLNKALVLPQITAKNIASQIKMFHGTSAKIAKPSDLLTTHNIKTQKQPPKALTTQNLKTQKGESRGYLTGVMHLMPSDLAGYGNVCPCASPECREMCLNTAGMWSNSTAVQNARRVKTELYFKNRPQFMKDLRRSIQALVRKAKKENLIPAVRINGTSDLPQVAMEMAKEFPEVNFYDYSKIKQPWKRVLPNYHITFSRSEVNEREALEALEHGINVAVVFNTGKGEPFPKEWKGYPVIDGDKHDLRFLDKYEEVAQEGKPVIVGLRGKGKARGKDKGSDSGFVVDAKPLVQIQLAPSEQLVTASARPHIEWFIEGCFDDAHLNSR